MVELLAAVAVAPWSQPLAFRALPSWRTGASGNVPSLYGPSPVRAPLASSAWIARNVRYRDQATADPPNRTLMHLRRDSVIVWAVIFETFFMPRRQIRLDLRHARHLRCCGGAEVVGGMYDLTGAGPGRAYAVIVRIFFGSRLTRALCLQAQRALDRLRLPPLR